MAPVSNFIVSGVLYAGSDFNEWANRMSAILRIEGLAKFTYEEAKASGFSFRARGRGPATDKKAALLILTSSAFVSAALLSRVIPWAKQEPNFLWEQLELQTKPFRFLDLPPELRNSIYGYSLGVGISHNIKSRNISPTVRNQVIKPATVVHPLCRVSQQLRRETLPLYWAMAEATYTLPWQAKKQGKKYAFNDDIIAWKNAHGAQIKFLTRFTLDLPYHDGDWPRKMRFSFDHNKGLTYTYETKGRSVLAPESEAKVQQLVASIEQDRKVTEQRGECILLALLSDSKLWRRGELRFEWK